MFWFGLLLILLPIAVLVGMRVGYDADGWYARTVEGTWAMTVQGGLIAAVVMGILVAMFS